MRDYKKVIAIVPIEVLLTLLFFSITGLTGCYGTKNAVTKSEPVDIATQKRPAHESTDSEKNTDPILRKDYLTKNTRPETKAIDLDKITRHKRKVTTFDAAGYTVTSFGDVTQTFTLPVKFYKQKPNHCGVAALRSILEYYNVSYSNKELEKIFNKDINATKVISIVNFANKYLDASSERIGYEQMVRILKRGNPLIIMRKLDNSNHYYVVKGYIVNEKKIVVNDGYKKDVILQVPAKGYETGNDLAIIFSKRG